MVANPTNEAARSFYEELTSNDDDSSLDLYVGPAAPSDDTSSWLETNPRRGFYLMFRLYSPTAPLFDGSWTLSERRADLMPSRPWGKVMGRRR